MCWFSPFTTRDGTHHQAWQQELLLTDPSYATAPADGKSLPQCVKGPVSHTPTALSLKGGRAPWSEVFIVSVPVLTDSGRGEHLGNIAVLISTSQLSSPPFPSQAEFTHAYAYPRTPAIFTHACTPTLLFIPSLTQLTPPCVCTLRYTTLACTTCVHNS